MSTTGRVRGFAFFLGVDDALHFGAAFCGVAVLSVAVDFRFAFAIARSAETYSEDTVAAPARSGIEYRRRERAEQTQAVDDEPAQHPH